MLSQILGGHRVLNPLGEWGKESLSSPPKLTPFGLRKSESFVNEL